MGHAELQHREAFAAWDEARAEDGAPRSLYAPLLEQLATRDLSADAAAVTAEVASEGAVFGGEGGWAFSVDPVPRLFAADDWLALSAGLQQRAAVLEAFVADIHGARRCISDGVVPAAVLDGCPFYEPDLFGLPDPPTARVAVAGMDLVRDDRGELLVLEDNCRTPSGLAYARAAALAVRDVLRPAPGRLRDYPEELALGLRAALLAARPPAARPGSEIVVISDGPTNTAWYEHQVLARLAGVDIVRPGQLVADGDVVRRSDTGAVLCVAYRRTDIDRLRDDRGRQTPLGAALTGALQAGTLTLLNSFGTGVADDKRVHAYVDDLTQYYLGEAPRLRSVTTLDLSGAAAREAALDRAAELVFKPRDGHGGHGVVIGPAASTAELDQVRHDVRNRPEHWIAQEVITLSTHPTVCGGVLANRHVDLRPFVLADGPRRWRVLPGGLTRVALAEGELIVNSSKGGGGKDTWVLT